MLLVIVLSLTGTMYVAWQFATEQEEAYNTQRLIRKEAAVQRSLEYTLDRLPHTFQTKDIPVAFSDRICELADIHGMDIALYHPSGRLLTQSSLNDDVGAEISLTVDVLKALSASDERIQGTNYGAAVKVYWNVRDQQNLILGIVAVRYERRALESGGFRAFWSQLAPLYVVLFLGGMIVAAILSNGLVKNLRIIRDRMRELDPQEAQTPIAYTRRDAIGELVDQYNELLKHLEVTVEELAKKERDGAWRIMAMQVAHEIKNPLTPIKLGAQHLERAWADNRPDFEERLKRHCRVVTEQIDVLSDIAQDFSMLAAVGLSEMESIDAVSALRESVAMYEAAAPNVKWDCDGISTESLWMKGSRPHLLRAFNNVLSNAVDAVEKEPQPMITVSAYNEGNQLIVCVEDNGMGMTQEHQSSIFQPRFTSKKKGTGLGLTITQSIVNQMNGSISVSSVHEVGTVFTVSFLATE
mgnify:FL=1